MVSREIPPSARADQDFYQWCLSEQNYLQTWFAQNFPDENIFTDKWALLFYKYCEELYYNN